ncbi:hypothetical protein E2C01_017905 [Portunus trituberculatus]|uniref:Uncharacterized protein n=1 Tax=Portunus trituberculatus TaxID=210409 RepID=A0A5B7DT60_PORTR|nr:hypothetical protein [Portunus trituberculatus]
MLQEETGNSYIIKCVETLQKRNGMNHAHWQQCDEPTHGFPRIVKDNGFITWRRTLESHWEHGVWWKKEGAAY